MKPSTSAFLRPAIAIALTFILHPSSYILAQGPLTPPGAPAPLFKTLDQVEPRTPISSIPINITQPGSYYLTTNLTQTVSGSAIDLSSDNITLDLNGFSLIGTNGPPASVGVRVLNARTNLVIRNGAVRNWNIGIALQGIPAGIVLENLRVVANSSNGVMLSGRTLVSQCLVHRNGGHGIFVEGSESIIRDCQITENGLDGVTATDSINRVTGNYVRGLTSGAGPNAGIRALASLNQIADNTVTFFSTGITVAGGSGNLVVRNFVHFCATNIVGGAGNLVGPTNAAGSATVTNHPWANFTD